MLDARAALVALAAGLVLAPAAADAHVIGFTTARQAAQLRADRYAGQRTVVRPIFRQNVHAFYAQASWWATDPHGCVGCGYDPNSGQVYDTPTREYHAIEMRVACIGPHTRANRRRSCSARAVVTGIFG